MSVTSIISGSGSPLKRSGLPAGSTYMVLPFHCITRDACIIGVIFRMPLSVFTSSVWRWAYSPVEISDRHNKLSNVLFMMMFFTKIQRLLLQLFIVVGTTVDHKIARRYLSS